MIEVVIGKPLVALESLDISENHYKTDERFLPKILVDLGLFKSNSEVRRNRPDLVKELNKPAFFEIKIGKKHIWIVVGEDEDKFNKVTYRYEDVTNVEDLTELYYELLPKDVERVPYDITKLQGKLCKCNGNGVFEIYPVTHEDVIRNKGKRYMACRVCGGVSHL